jgi:hypothetical protein
LLEVSGQSGLVDAWLGGNDFVLRAVAARTAGKEAADHESLLALAGHGDLEVRLEVLRGMAQRSDSHLVGRALEVAASDKPTVWTCRWCGSLESFAEWDCSNCSKGTRSDLEEEIARITKKVKLASD